jgi:hypothetical protein
MFIVSRVKFLLGGLIFLLCLSLSAICSACTLSMFGLMLNDEIQSPYVLNINSWCTLHCNNDSTHVVNHVLIWYLWQFERIWSFTLVFLLLRKIYTILATFTVVFSRVSLSGNVPCTWTNYAISSCQLICWHDIPGILSTLHFGQSGMKWPLHYRKQLNFQASSIGFPLSSIGPWSLKISSWKLRHFRQPPTKIT